MSTPLQNYTVRSEAEKRVITVTTEAGDPVIYSGNPAELPGARHETRKAMKRSGVFKLLVTHNASRLPNGVIAVDHLDNIPIITNTTPVQTGSSHATRNPGSAVLRLILSR